MAMLSFCRFREIATKCRGFSTSRNLLFSKPLEELNAVEDSPNYEKHEKIKLQNSGKARDATSIAQLAENRFIYPEFLPNSDFEFRNKIREKLERQDMLKRRNVIDIPEFYVGSILAVTVSDKYAAGKTNRFVGICISRSYCGLRATFTLRNVVDKQGVEIMYDMYSPIITNIEVLRLEKRLDDELLYLRDALPEYSTFPFDMESDLRPEGEPVPVNPLKVKLKPGQWYARWEFFDLKGVDVRVNEKRQRQAEKQRKPWEKYDLMKEYRKAIPEEDQIEIWQDLEAHKEQFHLKKLQWKQKSLQKAAPKK